MEPIDLKALSVLKLLDELKQFLIDFPSKNDYIVAVQANQYLNMSWVNRIGECADAIKNLLAINTAEKIRTRYQHNQRGNALGRKYYLQCPEDFYVQFKDDYKKLNELFISRHPQYKQWNMDDIKQLIQGDKEYLTIVALIKSILALEDNELNKVNMLLLLITLGHTAKNAESLRMLVDDANIGFTLKLEDANKILNELLGRKFLIKEGECYGLNTGNILFIPFVFISTAQSGKPNRFYLNFITRIYKKDIVNRDYLIKKLFNFYFISNEIRLILRKILDYMVSNKFFNITSESSGYYLTKANTDYITKNLDSLLTPENCFTSFVEGMNAALLDSQPEIILPRLLDIAFKEEADGNLPHKPIKSQLVYYSELKLQSHNSKTFTLNPCRYVLDAAENILQNDSLVNEHAALVIAKCIANALKLKFTILEQSDHDKFGIRTISFTQENEELKALRQSAIECLFKLLNCTNSVSSYASTNAIINAIDNALGFEDNHNLKEEAILIYSSSRLVLERFNGIIEKFPSCFYLLNSIAGTVSHFWFRDYPILKKYLPGNMNQSVKKHEELINTIKEKLLANKEYKFYTVLVCNQLYTDYWDSEEELKYEPLFTDSRKSAYQKNLSDFIKDFQQSEISAWKNRLLSYQNQIDNDLTAASSLKLFLKKLAEGYPEKSLDLTLSIYNNGSLIKSHYVKSICSTLLEAILTGKNNDAIQKVTVLFDNLLDAENEAIINSLELIGYSLLSDNTKANIYPTIFAKLTKKSIQLNNRELLNLCMKIVVHQPNNDYKSFMPDILKALNTLAPEFSTTWTGGTWGVRPRVAKSFSNGLNETDCVLVLSNLENLEKYTSEIDWYLSPIATKHPNLLIKFLLDSYSIKKKYSLGYLATTIKLIRCLPLSMVIELMYENFLSIKGMEQYDFAYSIVENIYPEFFTENKNNVEDPAVISSMNDYLLHKLESGPESVDFVLTMLNLIKQTVDTAIPVYNKLVSKLKERTVIVKFLENNRRRITASGLYGTAEIYEHLKNRYENLSKKEKITPQVKVCLESEIRFLDKLAQYERYRAKQGISARIIDWKS